MDPRSGSGIAFAKRIYLPRCIGLGIGFFCVAVPLWSQQPVIWLWALLLFNGFVWPHLAYRWARHSAMPFQGERRNLLIDSLFGGFWAAAMHFNALPSVTILAMMGMNNIAAGGGRFFAQGLLAMLAGMLLNAMLSGFSVVPQTSMAQLYACLPMLVLYPLSLGWVSYRLSIQLAEHKQALRATSRTDSLTRLFNHGHWKDLLQQEFELCRRQHRRASVALIDLDHFKEINDCHGHLVGDAVLRLVSERLVLSLRRGDMAGRYGGDEFCVILPDTSPVPAVEVMERLREQIASVRCELAPEVRLSLSIGVAGISPFQRHPDDWLGDADRALYQAKHAGRDRVLVASEQAGKRDAPRAIGE